MQHGEYQPDVPIILLPGLNGDVRVFGPQVLAFPSLTVGRWIPPVASESLARYAKRMAGALDPGRPCVVGGVSFGGLVALEMARHLQARVCVVIASSRDVSGLPTTVRLLRPLAAILPLAVLTLAAQYGSASAVRIFPACGRRIARLSPDELAFRRWAVQALLTWRGVRPTGCEVVQIHGERDATFAASRTKADVLVPGAGHMLTVTHARQVNEFIHSAVRQSAA